MTEEQFDYFNSALKLLQNLNDRCELLKEGMKEQEIRLRAIECFLEKQTKE